MTMLRKTCGSAIIASMLAASATPALARPGYGWGGWGYGRHWHHHGGDGFGNFLLGAIVAGGAIALASSASKTSRERDGVSYGTSDYYYDRGREISEDPRSWSDAEYAAADACADGVEALASRRGDDQKVDDIRSVDPDRNGYRVEGVMASGRPFVCGVNRGEVTYIQKLS